MRRGNYRVNNLIKNKKNGRHSYLTIMFGYIVCQKEDHYRTYFAKKYYITSVYVEWENYDQQI